MDPTLERNDGDSLITSPFLKVDTYSAEGAAEMRITSGYQVSHCGVTQFSSDIFWMHRVESSVWQANGKYIDYEWVNFNVCFVSLLPICISLTHYRPLPNFYLCSCQLLGRHNRSLSAVPHITPTLHNSDRPPTPPIFH